jgi:type III secretion protein U
MKLRLDALGRHHHLQNAVEAGMAEKDNQSEQKALPASDKKLRDARKKGQSSNSRDLISGFGLLAMIAYLLLVWPTLRDHVLALVDLVSRLSVEPFGTAWRMALSASLTVLWVAVAPAIGILLLTSVVAGMIGSFGPVFSFHPIKPNFEHINPAAGFKRIFSLRNVVEFAKGATKVVVLGTVFFFVLRAWLQSMFHAPHCGEHCIVPLLLDALKPIVAIAVFAFMAIGIFDTGLQRWLFLRDMRMTKTEQKRERKDVEGDPLILGERKRERQRQGRLGRMGLQAASVVIAGDGHLAGIHYHAQNAPLPVVVTKARGQRSIAMREEAASLGIPVIQDNALAAALVDAHSPGDHLQQKYFGDVAQILVTHNLT